MLPAVLPPSFDQSPRSSNNVLGLPRRLNGLRRSDEVSEGSQSARFSEGAHSARFGERLSNLSNVSREGLQTGRARSNGFQKTGDLSFGQERTSNGIRSPPAEERMSFNSNCGERKSGVGSNGDRVTLTSIANSGGKKTKTLGAALLNKRVVSCVIEDLSVASLQGQWKSSTDKSANWSIKENGKVFHKGRFAGVENQIRMDNGVLIRGDGWQADMDQSTSSVLVWEKHGEPNVVWSRVKQDISLLSQPEVPQQRSSYSRRKEPQSASLAAPVPEDEGLLSWPSEVSMSMPEECEYMCIDEAFELSDMSSLSTAPMMGKTFSAPAETCRPSLPPLTPRSKARNKNGIAGMPANLDSHSDMSEDDGGGNSRPFSGARSSGFNCGGSVGAGSINSLWRAEGRTPRRPRGFAKGTRAAVGGTEAGGLEEIGPTSSKMSLFSQESESGRLTGRLTGGRMTGRGERLTGGRLTEGNQAMRMTGRSQRGTEKTSQDIDQEMSTLFQEPAAFDDLQSCNSFLELPVDILQEVAEEAGEEAQGTTTGKNLWKEAGTKLPKLGAVRQTIEERKEGSTSGTNLKKGNPFFQVVQAARAQAVVAGMEMPRQTSGDSNDSFKGKLEKMDRFMGELEDGDEAALRPEEKSKAKEFIGHTSDLRSKVQKLRRASNLFGQMASNDRKAERQKAKGRLAKARDLRGETEDSNSDKDSDDWGSNPDTDSDCDWEELKVNMNDL